MNSNVTLIPLQQFVMGVMHETDNAWCVISGFDFLQW